MRYFLSYNGRTYGPYLEREIQDWWKVRQIPDDALICKAGTEEWTPLVSVMPNRTLASPTKIPQTEIVPPEAAIVSPLSWLIPWRTVVSLEWLNESGLIALLVIGLLPIGVIIFFPTVNTYWMVSIYFSILWALFLYHFFKTPETRFPACLVAFFFTPLFSIATLLEAQRHFPLLQLDAATESNDFWTRFMGFLFGVGFSEELCKAAVVFLLVWRARRAFPPSTAVLYGMMSGLGFGIFEGIFYQQYVNPSAGAEVGYLLNISRITSLPFLHAMWSGLAAYFIGTGRFIENGRWISSLFGVLMAANLHGCYDQFSGTWPSLAVAVCSVVLILVYLFNCRKLESSLFVRDS